ncbi:N-acetylmuramoyl-L-alanine amidase [Actinacidiphila bryophytorum]|uniref:N-acetylmuramoyl-L-alanine amidase n=1 Tax=Actinacidiphila bryophytorum TaxID=1436133 RepID=UPI002176A08F|nr:N-acetylmuramoyl-L-alanine amidase [Actinacidiphila bryophytorum]UWE08675.1 N-acetylmuramoyl-L-alanine amidase [Actinacidiphila bryophytorum]
MFSNESHGGARSRSLVVTAVVVAAALVAGWFVYDAHRGSDSGPAAGLGPAGTSSATPAAGGSPVAQGDAGGTPRATSATPTPTRAKELAGKTVVIDPGHNLGNAKHTAEINKLVDIGTNRKPCDTTGTATNAGYPEATYTLDVSHRVRALLQARGAKVVLTYDGDRAWGPCVDERARIGNAAHADAALSIHADGAPADKFGFHVIAPKSVHKGMADTRAVAGPSLLLATTLRSHFNAVTGEPVANYLGGKGLTIRDDLGGLNLTRVPKVFIECGNMRNAHDAAALTNAAWRQQAAQGIADGITAFLEGKR